MRPEERWAMEVIEFVLHLPVEEHDDNSEDSMYDLRIGRPEAPSHAIEVTSAVEPSFVRAWKELERDDHTWPVDGLRGDCEPRRVP